MQAQILNLIEDLKARFDLTVVFIAHDLGVVKAISDRVLIMYLGKVCEFGDPDVVYARPAHPYTRALLDSVPAPDPARPFRGPAPAGDVPSPLAPPSGCRFRGRCPRAQARCAEEEPVLTETSPGRVRRLPLPPCRGGAGGERDVPERLVASCDGAGRPKAAGPDALFGRGQPSSLARALRTVTGSASRCSSQTRCSFSIVSSRPAPSRLPGVKVAGSFFMPLMTPVVS